MNTAEAHAAGTMITTGTIDNAYKVIDMMYDSSLAVNTEFVRGIFGQKYNSVSVRVILVQELEICRALKEYFSRLNISMCMFTSGGHYELLAETILDAHNLQKILDGFIQDVACYHSYLI